jgi:hypothetical protein
MQNDIRELRPDISRMQNDIRELFIRILGSVSRFCQRMGQFLAGASRGLARLMPQRS